MKRLLLCGALCLGPAGPAAAQLVFQEPRAVRSAPAYQIWEQYRDSVSETFSQFSFPLAVFYPLGELGELNVSGQFAHSRYVGPLRSGRFGAVGDVAVDYVNDIWRDRAAISLRLNLPLGTTALSPDEFFVAQQITSPLLPFRVKHYGEGAGLSAGVALAGGERWLYGASLRATYRGPYTPVDGGPDYRPGSGLDLILQLTSEEQGWAFSLAGTAYSADRLNDTAWFRDGAQLDLLAARQFSGPRDHHDVSVRTILRAADSRLGADGSLETEAENSNGIDLRLGYTYTRQLSTHWTGGLGAAWKHLGPNGYPLDSLRYRGSGDLVSLGLDVGRAWAGARMELGFTLFVGSVAESRRLDLAEPDLRLRIRGFELQAGYVWTW